MNRPGDQTVGLQLPQRFGQHFLADVPDVRGQLGEPERAVFLEHVQDDHRPLVCQPSDHLPHQLLDLNVAHTVTLHEVTIVLAGAYFPMESERRRVQASSGPASQASAQEDL